MIYHGLSGQTSLLQTRTTSMKRQNIACKGYSELIKENLAFDRVFTGSASHRVPYSSFRSALEKPVVLNEVPLFPESSSYDRALSC